MNCVKVREYLSEYIDESLEATTKALVEEHLSTCEDCQKEVASLRMLIDDLGSMETVSPPKDFLDQLHKRIERRSWFSKTLDILSTPTRVKLPMKLAGALVMAVLVFTIFQMQEDQYGTKIVPIVQEPTHPEPSSPKMAKTPLRTGVQEEADSSRTIKEKAKPMPQAAQAVAQKDEENRLLNNAVKEIAQVETKTDYSSREGGAIELSNMKDIPPVQKSTQLESPPKMAKAPLGTGLQEETDNTGVVWERVRPKLQATVQAVVQKDDAINLSHNDLKKISHVDAKADHPSWKGAPIELSLVMKRVQSDHALEATSDMEASKRTREMKRNRTLNMEEVVPTTQHLLPRLNEIIERTGGEVVAVEYKEGNHTPEFVYIEIPAEQIDIFQNDLQTLGELHGAPISPTGKDEDILSIRIKILTP